MRAKFLKIDELIAALYTLPGFDFPAGPDGEALVAPDILLKEERGHYRAACKVVELPRELEKPNPEGVQRICADFGVEPREILVVGDSLKKDVAVAKALGAVDCWAEYGTYVSAEYRERLDIVSAKAITQRHAASLYEAHDATAQATHALSNFGQVLKIIDAHAGQRA
jgi:phosphoglycolate phosphatase